MGMSFLDTIKYADEEEAQTLIEDMIQKQAEENVEKVKSILIALLKSPERKARRAVLRAIKNVGFADKDIIGRCAVLTKEDSEKSVRDLAYETVLSVLKNASLEKKKELVVVILRLVSKGKAMIDVTDVIESIGEDFARQLLTDSEIDNETKGTIKFALEYLESQKK